MTDRLKGVYVTFEKDIREDDAEHLINAIRAFRYVADVRGEVTDVADHFARQRVRFEIARNLLDLHDKITNPGRKEDE